MRYSKPVHIYHYYDEQVKIELKDLKCKDFMYYVGTLTELDSEGWVTKEEAIEILKKVNQ
jgi:hypothetical protein